MAAFRMAWASGIGRLNPETEQWQVLTVADGLVSNGVVALLHDQDDAVLIGTEGGISRFDGSTWQSYQEADGLAGGIVTTMFRIARASTGWRHRGRHAALPARGAAVGYV